MANFRQVNNCYRRANESFNDNISESAINNKIKAIVKSFNKNIEDLSASIFDLKDKKIIPELNHNPRHKPYIAKNPDFKYQVRLSGVNEIS